MSGALRQHAELLEVIANRVLRGPGKPFATQLQKLTGCADQHTISQHRPLLGHPKAKRAYAWSHREGKNDEGERLVAVLDIPPVDSALMAVRVQIVKDVKEKRK